jgi:DNA-binding IclR family transcriptional regulator
MTAFDYMATLTAVTMLAAPTERNDDALPSPPTARVVRVLELFARRPVEPLGLAEVARVLGLSRSTTHAILNTLVELGWLTRDDNTKSYALAAGLVAVGRAAEAGYPAVSQAAAELAALSARYDMAMSVAAVFDDEIRVLDAVVPASRAGGVVQVGLSVPFAPPFGAVFAAWGPPSRTQQWLDRAPAGAAAAHEATLRAVLGRGFAVERLNDTSRRIRDVLARLGGLAGGREAQSALLPLMAGFGASDDAEPPSADDACPVDYLAVPVLDRFGHSALSITAEVDGPITRTALQRLAGDLLDAAARVSAGITGKR